MYIKIGHCPVVHLSIVNVLEFCDHYSTLSFLSLSNVYSFEKRLEATAKSAPEIDFFYTNIYLGQLCEM